VSSFLIDECVPRVVYEMLEREGHHVTLVRDALPGATDEDVLRFAHDRNLVLISERFGPLAINAKIAGGVVIISLGSSSPEIKRDRVRHVLPSVLPLIPGNVTVIGRTNVRRRSLAR
jgi:predicted nuclease of predicted toxin-antitoxin system